MPPALHPRSSMTLSLFTTTLALSFLVVGLPHLVPCPVQPQAYADDGTPLPQQRRRRRKIESAETISTSGDDFGKEGPRMSDLVRDADRRRECPVPKPGGLVGQMLGVRKAADGQTDKPVVRVERFEARPRRITGEEGDGKG